MSDSDLAVLLSVVWTLPLLIVGTTTLVLIIANLRGVRRTRAVAWPVTAVALILLAFAWWNCLGQATARDGAICGSVIGQALIDDTIYPECEGNAWPVLLPWTIVTIATFAAWAYVIIRWTSRTDRTPHAPESSAAPDAAATP
ncbi:hypothetical protein [Isoptericola sp. NPDC057191]|uniref:hypothetical protein n=1 Tax=Isoptericola sp. NPDC057191 TaxID=3346041 RepID=UPI00362A7771